MTGEPLVSIIILNWNGKEVTDKCLSSLFKVTDYPSSRLTVVVIDNDSTDGSVEFLKEKFFGQIDILILEENIGFIRGNNLGIKTALEKYRSDYIILLNNDIEVTQKSWLRKLIETAEQDEKIGIVGPKLIFPDGKVQWSGRRRESNTFFLIFQTISAGFNPGVGSDEKVGKNGNFVGEVNTISGACMLIKTDLFGKMGLLDESLVPMFGEDVEYCFRAWKNGYKVIYRGDVIIIHYQSYTIEKFKDKLETKKFYWSLRNGVIISKRYFGFWKTLLLGLPIFTFATFFDKKDKSTELNLNNIKLRNNLLSKVPLFLSTIKYIFR